MDPEDRSQLELRRGTGRGAGGPLRRAAGDPSIHLRLRLGSPRIGGIPWVWKDEGSLGRTIRRGPNPAPSTEPEKVGLGWVPGVSTF